MSAMLCWLHMQRNQSHAAGLLSFFDMLPVKGVHLFFLGHWMHIPCIVACQGEFPANAWATTPTSFVGTRGAGQGGARAARQRPEAAPAIAVGGPGGSSASQESCAGWQPQQYQGQLAAGEVPPQPQPPEPIGVAGDNRGGRGGVPLLFSGFVSHELMANAMAPKLRGGLLWEAAGPRRPAA
jgi:hypothetical protein